MKQRKSAWPLTFVVLAAITGIGASLVLDLDAVKIAIGSDFLRTVWKFAALALAATPGILSFARAEHRASAAARLQAARDGVQELASILSSAIVSLFDGELPQHIRANVMICANGKLRMFANANMGAFLDYQMELSKGQGCAGEAWRQAEEDPVNGYWKPVLARGNRMSKAALKTVWKLNPEQIRKTADIIWVMSIPLLSNSKGRRDFIGVLNFDGVGADLKRPSVFQRQDFIISCMRMSERIVEHLMGTCKATLDNLDNRFRAL
jgi:hypothetical protein